MAEKQLQLGPDQGGLDEKIATETGPERSDWSRCPWACRAKDPEEGREAGPSPRTL